MQRAPESGPHCGWKSHVIKGTWAKSRELRHVVLVGAWNPFVPSFLKACLFVPQGMSLRSSKHVSSVRPQWRNASNCSLPIPWSVRTVRHRTWSRYTNHGRKHDFRDFREWFAIRMSTGCCFSHNERDARCSNFSRNKQGFCYPRTWWLRLLLSKLSSGK